MKIVLGSVRDIPLDRLELSQSNVRRIKAGISVEDLAADIARRGLLTALSVRPVLDEAGTETGRFEVPAGGRRFQALQRLVKAKRLAKTVPVPCVVKTDDAGISATDDSLAENMHRVALHPLDQFRAFQALAAEGQSEEDIAARWFVTPAVVRQRLRLAAVSPTILAHYAEDALTLEQVMAFTVTTDHARQEEVYDRRQTGWQKEPYHIRNLLTQGAVSARDRRVRYIGLAAYEAEGGIVLRDLFTGDGEGWLEDPLLLDRLALAQLETAAVPVAAEGWKWCEVALDFPYGHVSGLRRLIPIGSGLTEDEERQREALQAELDDLEAKHADDPDDPPEDVDQRLGEIEAELDRLDAIPARFDEEDRSRGGVFVSLGGDGTMRIERGFVRPEDEVPVEPVEGEDQQDADAAARPDTIEADAGTADETDGIKPYPERLLAELSAARTIALRDAVAEVPEVALTLLLHRLMQDLFGVGTRSAGCLDIAARPTYLPVQASNTNASPPAVASAARHAAWAELLPVDDEAALWDELATMADADRAALLAHCVGACVNARWEKVDRYGGGSGLSVQGLADRMAAADRVAGAVALDMAASGWRPTSDNFLGQVTKPQILAAVREGAGDMAAGLIDHLKKPDMAREAERVLADTGWLPTVLRTPGLAGTGYAASDDDMTDGEPLAVAAE